MRYVKLTAFVTALALLLMACAAAEPTGENNSTLIYGSGDYTRINPAMDEHGEINALLFDGLTARDADNAVIPSLAKSWEYDADTYTYTFHLAKGVKWHDGEPFDASDVKFTLEAVMEPDNASENAPNFEDVTEITAVDEHTLTVTLEAPNAAFLDYMTLPVLPEHLLKGEDMQTSAFFRAPVGTGPYELESWDEGQSIVLTRNDDYFKGAAQIETVVFKIVPDDNARAMQLLSGELDMALVSPRDSKLFEGRSGYEVYRMETSDYRGIMFNFNNPYWTANRDLIPAICCAIDREAIVDAVLLGFGEAAYGPLMRNVYNCEDAERWEYDTGRARALLEDAGCVMREDGFYHRDGERIGFTISVGAGDQVRADIAQAAAQQLKEVGIDADVEIPAVVDWANQSAYLIGWGSPFDADDHTYKVFGSGKAANYGGYSNARVDEYLIEARRTEDVQERAEAYANFQRELANDPAMAFICYVDAVYAANESIKGIPADSVMGHHGVGVFKNITEWTLGG